MDNGAWLRIALLALCAWGALACSDKPEPTVGGDTHWLELCDNDGSCGRGLCTCGVCTEACSRDAQCSGGPEAQCYETASPGVGAACASGAPPEADMPGICLARCTSDRECADGLRCAAVACVPARTPVLDASAANDASTASAPVSARPATRASELADLQPSVSFDGDPLPVPTPARVFTDPADALLGRWRDPGCNPADLETVHFTGGCVTLTIERSAANGEIKGQLSSYTEIDTSQWVTPQQTFAPAVDADVGYPVEVPPESYVDLRDDLRMGPYSLLDPHFDGTRLQFWLSSLELWEGWCELQTPYRVPDGDPPYQCVPDGAARGDFEVERGKLALCTSEWSSGRCELTICDDPEGNVCQPPIVLGCGCYSPDGYALERPECSPAHCRCDADGCVANWYERRTDFELVLDGDRLTAREGFNGTKRGGTNMASLQREVTP
jgi:hypothetical protein